MTEQPRLLRPPYIPNTHARELQRQRAALIRGLGVVDVADPAHISWTPTFGVQVIEDIESIAYNTQTGQHEQVRIPDRRIHVDLMEVSVSGMAKNTIRLITTSNTIFKQLRNDVPPQEQRQIEDFGFVSRGTHVVPYKDKHGRYQTKNVDVRAMVLLRNAIEPHRLPVVMEAIRANAPEEYQGLYRQTLVKILLAKQNVFEWKQVMSKMKPALFVPGITPPKEVLDDLKKMVNQMHKTLTEWQGYISQVFGVDAAADSTGSELFEQIAAECGLPVVQIRAIADTLYGYGLSEKAYQSLTQQPLPPADSPPAEKRNRYAAAVTGRTPADQQRFFTTAKRVIRGQILDQQGEINTVLNALREQTVHMDMPADFAASILRYGRWRLPEIMRGTKPMRYERWIQRALVRTGIVPRDHYPYTVLDWMKKEKFAEQLAVPSKELTAVQTEIAQLYGKDRKAYDEAWTLVLKLLDEERNKNIKFFYDQFPNILRMEKYMEGNEVGFEAFAPHPLIDPAGGNRPVILKDGYLREDVYTQAEKEFGAFPADVLLLIQKELAARRNLTALQHEITNTVLHYQSHLHPQGYKGWQKQEGQYAGVFEVGRNAYDEELLCVSRVELLMAVLNDRLGIHMGTIYSNNKTSAHSHGWTQDGLFTTRWLEPSGYKCYSYYPMGMPSKYREVLRRAGGMQKIDDFFVQGGKMNAALVEDDSLLIADQLSWAAKHMKGSSQQAINTLVGRMRRT